MPKFGEWDVNNPASADGFTVIFAKARDEKKTSGTAANGTPPQTNNHQSKPPENYQYPPPVCINHHQHIYNLSNRVSGCRVLEARPQPTLYLSVTILSDSMR